MSTYEEVPTINNGHYSLMGQYIYGISRSGIKNVSKDLISLDMPAANTYSRILGEKRYEGSNHLGNVLTVFTDRRNGVDLNKPNLVQSSDYYAFGMAMPGRTLGSSSNDYRYGLNGVIAQPDLPNVTNAYGGQGFHNYGLAIDVAFKRNGTVDWSVEDYNRLSTVGTDLGFSWGGSWRTPDRPHFEMTFGYAWADLLKRVNDGTTIENNGNTYPDLTPVTTDE